MKKFYRKGAVGALMDEYERAAQEIKSVIEQISDSDYERIFDRETKDEDCRSIQTIVSHVVRASYGYANLIRSAFSFASEPVERRLLSKEEVFDRLDAAMKYTAEALDGRWEMTDEEMAAIVIHSNWGVTYDLEQIIEHAIVHILRHRRQIEKFLVSADTA